MATVVIETHNGPIKLTIDAGTGACGPVGHALAALVAAGLLEEHRRESVLAQARLRCLAGGVLWTVNAKEKS
jgi:hypothetical protein